MQIKHLIQMALMGCATAGLISCNTMQNYSKAVGTWHGASEQALIAHWGKPTDVTHLANGNHLDIYHVAERNHDRDGMYWNATPFVRVSPQTRNTLSHTSPIMSNRDNLFWCDTTFVVNPSHMIVDSHFSGNNCVASEKGAKRWTY